MLLLYFIIIGVLEKMFVNRILQIVFINMPCCNTRIYIVGTSAWWLMMTGSSSRRICELFLTREFLKNYIPNTKTIYIMLMVGEVSITFT